MGISFILLAASVDTTSSLVNWTLLQLAVDREAHISPDLPRSRHISPCLPTSPHVSRHLLKSRSSGERCCSLEAIDRGGISPHISPYLAISRHISP